MTPEEGERWKKLAVYLAECHAGTAEYDALLSSTSRARRERFASICLTAAKGLDGDLEASTRMIGGRSIEDTKRRCLDAAKLINVSK